MWLLFIFAGLLGAAGYAVFPTTVLGGDNAEWVTLSVVGGVAHPPGYPLYSAWLRLAGWLSPRGSAPPTVAAVATFVTYLAALFTLHLAQLRLRVRSEVSLGVVALVGASPLVFSLGTHAEVFAPLLMQAAILLWAAVTQRALVFGLVMGLGAAHHHSLILLGPLVLLLLGTRRAWVRLLAGSALGLLGAATAYAWLAGQSELPLTSALIFRRLTSVRDVIQHVMRSDYGSLQLFSAANQGAGAWVSPLAHLPGLIGSFLDATLVLPLYWLLKVKKGKESLALWLCVLCSGPVFFALFNAPPNEYTSLFTERFVALPLFMSAPLLALGAQATVEAKHERRLPQQSLSNLALLVLVLQLARAVPQARSHHQDDTEAVARHMLHSLPENAVAIARGDQHVFGIYYVQKVAHERTDVVATGLEAYHIQAHADALNQRLQKRAFTVGGNLSQTLTALPDRHVYFTASLLAKVPSLPCGMMAQVRIKPEVTVNDLGACEAEFQAAIAAHPPLQGFANEPSGWGGLNADDVGQVWLALSRGWSELDEPMHALRCEQQAWLYAPWLAW